MGFFDLFKSKEKEKTSSKHTVSSIRKRYYSTYNEFPYISSDRDFEDWMKKVNMFPNMLVQPEMMKRNDDNLLPGHIYLLYWMNKYNSDRRIPEYFEYKYGMNFNDGKKFIESKSYIKNWEATESGQLLMKKYSEVINNHQSESLGIRNLDRDSEMKRYNEGKRNSEKAGLKEDKTELEHEGYLDQMEGIDYYKLKDFKNAEKYFLKAMDKGFVTPGGLDYLAKIYRKKKDYKSEVEILEKGIQVIQEKNGKIYDKNQKRLKAAQILFEKIHRR